MEKGLKIIIIFLASVASTSIFACSCQQLDFAHRFNNSESVFIANLNAAKVVTPSEEKEWPYVEGTFRVTDIYKGNPPEEIKIKTGMGDGDCGIQMSIARKYIIFKGESEYIGICGGSTAINPYNEGKLAKKLRSLGVKPKF